MGAQPSLPPLKFPWQTSYLAAVLETDNSRLTERIRLAEEQITSRMSTVTTDERDEDERVAINDALRGLTVLKRERLAEKVSEQFGVIKGPNAGGFSEDPPASR